MTKAESFLMIPVSQGDRIILVDAFGGSLVKAHFQFALEVNVVFQDIYL